MALLHPCMKFKKIFGQKISSKKTNTVDCMQWAAAHTCACVDASQERLGSSKNISGFLKKHSHFSICIGIFKKYFLNFIFMLNIHKYLVETQVHKKGILLQMEFLPIVYRLQCSKSFLVRYSSHSSPTNSKRNNDSARCFQLIISTQFLKVLKQLLFFCFLCISIENIFV